MDWELVDSGFDSLNGQEI